MMFQDLNRSIREEVITLLFHAEVSAQGLDAVVTLPLLAPGA